MSFMKDQNPIAYLTIPANSTHARLNDAMNKIKTAYPDWFTERKYQTSRWERHFPMTQDAGDFVAEAIEAYLQNQCYQLSLGPPLNSRLGNSSPEELQKFKENMDRLAAHAQAHSNKSTAPEG